MHFPRLYAFICGWLHFGIDIGYEAADGHSLLTNSRPSGRRGPRDLLTVTILGTLLIIAYRVVLQIRPGQPSPAVGLGSDVEPLIAWLAPAAHSAPPKCASYIEWVTWQQ